MRTSGILALTFLAEVASFATSPSLGFSAASLPGRACSSRAHGNALCRAPSRGALRSHTSGRGAVGTASMALGVGDELKTPESLAEMMQKAAGAVQAAMGDGKKKICIEVPLPITGGTELDDWPGGIGQKYLTMRPMVNEMLKTMGWEKNEVVQKNFIGYQDDAIGVWKKGDVTVCCFATPEVLKDLKKMCETGTLVLVNHQFFLDPFSSKDSKDFITSLDQAYLLQSLNMKGPGLLPIKGVLLREYPTPFLAARKMDGGVRQVLASYPSKPERKVLDDLFFSDSEERDKNLSLFDRLKKIQQEASNI